MTLNEQLAEILKPHIDEAPGEALVTLLELSGQLAVALWAVAGIDYDDFCDQVHDILSGEMEIIDTIH